MGDGLYHSAATGRADYKGMVINGIAKPAKGTYAGYARPEKHKPISLSEIAKKADL